MSHFRRLLFLLSCCFAATQFTPATLYAQTGNVSGVVMDSSRQVLVGAQVQIEGLSLSTTTGDSGRYLLLGAPAGSVRITHELFSNTPLRLSFSRGLARPNYNSLAPFVLQDSTGLTISRGNPGLKVTTSSNVDGSLERYFQNVGIVSGGFFYKRLGRYIYQTTSLENIGSEVYRVTQPVNGGDASVYGAEFNLVRKLDFLPGLLNGFSLYGNYTSVHSNAQMPRGESILPGQASNMGNASLAYEKRGFSARAAFNYQGAYVLASGATAAEDNWLDNRLQIDFSAGQRINKHARVFIDLLNLGNNPYRVYVGDTRHPIQEERYKMWAITGLKLDF